MIKPTTPVYYRIDSELMPLLDRLAKQWNTTKSGYAGLIMTRHLRRMERKEAKLQAALTYLRTTPHQPAGRTEEQKQKAIDTVEAIHKSRQERTEAIEQALSVGAIHGQSYYWTPEWQEGEKEADTDLEAGQSKTFDNVEEAIAWLKEDKEQADA